MRERNGRVPECKGEISFTWASYVSIMTAIRLIFENLWQFTADNKVNAIVLSIACIYTSIKIIKNEVGCRDDTVPKTVDTRRHCEEE